MAMTTLRKDARAKARRADKKVSPVASETRDTVVRAAGTSYDWAAPKVEAARDWAAPRLEPAVDKVRTDLAPKVAGAVAAALAASEPTREEAKSRGTAAIAALKGEVAAPKPRKRRLGKLLLLTATVAAAVAAWKAWTAWSAQRSDLPEPWAGSTSYGAGSVTPVATHPTGDDLAGAGPDEALADASAVPAAPATDQPTVTTESVSPEQADRVDDASGRGPQSG